MNKRFWFAAGLAVLSMAAVAADQGQGLQPAGNPPQLGPQGRPQLLTPEEREAFRERMRNAKTPEERQAIKAEQHQKMQARAKEKGITLPDSGRGPGAVKGQDGKQQGRPQLLTPEERKAFQDRMHNAKTPEERQAIRAEQHQKMQARAKEKGITLPLRGNGPRGGAPGSGKPGN